MTIFVAAILYLACCPFAYAANNFSSDTHELSQAPLTQSRQEISLGEHLIYDVSWMGIPVGVGELWVKEKAKLKGRDCYHVVAIAATNDFLSKIYPVHDEVHSWIDAETFESLQFEKKVSEGFYRADEKVVYDAAKKKAYYESLKNGSKKEFEISLPVHDILSAFYWARRQPLEVGKFSKTTVNSDEKDWDLEIQVLRRETKELRGVGKFDTLVIEPKTKLKGVLEKRGRVWIHLQNNEARTPVWVTFKTPLGPIVGVLRRDLK